MVDDNVEALAREARRELGIRPAVSIEEPCPVAMAPSERRSAVLRTGWKRAGGNAGEKEVWEKILSLFDHN